MIDRLLPALSLAVSVIAVFVALDYWPLILVLLGLVHGFASREMDRTIIVTVLVAAVALPTIADSLDAIPTIGSYLNAIIDNFAIAIAGYAIACFAWDIWSRIMPEGSDSGL